MKWTKQANEDFTGLGDIYSQVTGQFSRYMGHVSRNVGGIHKTPRVVEDTEPVFEFASKVKQVEAVSFLNQQLFATPTWLISNEVYSRTGGSPITIIGGIQDNTLNRLFSATTLKRLINAESAIGNNAYKMTELFSDLKKGIWSELPGRKPIDIYRRNLQKSYVNILNNLLNPAEISISLGAGFSIAPTVNTNKSDIKSFVRAHPSALRAEVIAAAGGTTDQMSKYHLQDIAKSIEDALNPKN